MIKKLMLRLLLFIMIIAFTAIVVVQWLWIKYAIKERENKFTSQVYDVLNRVVNRVDEINYIRYRQELNQHLDEFNDFSEFLNDVYTDKSSSSIFSNDLQSFFNNGIRQLNGDRSYLKFSNNLAFHTRSGKLVDQEYIIQTIKSVDPHQIDSLNFKEDYFNLVNQNLKDFMIRLLKEKDPENVSISERLQNVDLYNLLVHYFKAYNITLPFTYDILSKDDLLNIVKSGNSHQLYYVDLFQQDLVKKGYYLGVRFESVQPLLLDNMGWLLLASGFCIFGLLFVFIFSILIIMRQQKLSVIKNDFINNMTHEFKTPIATISLATSAITKERVLNDKEQILKFNAMIKSENSRMNKYVERILQQAKLDRKELQLNFVDVDLNELVRESVEHFILLVQEAGGTLNCNLGEGDFVHKVDEVHMMNVVCNLLDNAIKYSGGVPDIQVSTHTDGKHISISVQDHGIGISKDAQKKVFKRFYRVTSGNLHDVKGFGLGLSYVKSVVELHGGIVRLTSKKNKGTLVEIEL